MMRHCEKGNTWMVDYHIDKKVRYLLREAWETGSYLRTTERVFVYVLMSTMMET